LRRRHPRLGLAAALDVQERVRELPPGGIAIGGDGVADDPELAPVAGADPALEVLGLAFRELVEVLGAAKRMVGVGSGDGRERLPGELGQAAGKHPLRRAVHPTRCRSGRR
jgi:hypothetical protein